MKKTGRTHYKDQTGDKSSIFDISSEVQLQVGSCTHTHTHTHKTGILKRGPDLKK